MNLVQVGNARSKALILFISIFLTMGLFNCGASKVRKLEVKGESTQAIEAKYGSPDVQVDFMLEEKMPEYRYGLLTRFPNFKEERVALQEWKWKQKRRTLIIWFEEKGDSWIAVEGLSYGNKVRF